MPSPKPLKKKKIDLSSDSGKDDFVPFDEWIPIQNVTPYIARKLRENPDSLIFGIDENNLLCFLISSSDL